MKPLQALRHWAGQSLLRRLWLSTTLMVALVGACTGAVSYALGYVEANRLQDVQLRQVAALVHAGGQMPDATLLTRAAEVDQDARIVVQRLGAPGGLPLPAGLAPGMHVLRAAGQEIWEPLGPVPMARHGGIIEASVPLADLGVYRGASLSLVIVLARDGVAAELLPACGQLTFTLETFAV